MQFKRITENRYDDVIIHLRNSFFADEPLNKAADLCQRGERNMALEDVSLKTLKENLSIMAVNENDEIAGCMLNGVLRPGDLEMSLENFEQLNDDKFKKIFKLIYSHNLKNDIFNHFNVEQIFDCRIMSVDARFRGRGIAQKMAEHAEILARSCDFKIMKADATGIYSAKILKTLGFVTLSELYYANYLDDNGKPILDVEPPHDKIQLLYKNLD